MVFWAQPQVDLRNICIEEAADVSILRVGIAENFQGFLIIVGNGPLRL